MPPEVTPPHPSTPARAAAVRVPLPPPSPVPIHFPGRDTTGRPVAGPSRPPPPPPGFGSSPSSSQDTEEDPNVIRRRMLEAEGAVDSLRQEVRALQTSYDKQTEDLNKLLNENLSLRQMDLSAGQVPRLLEENRALQQQIDGQAAQLEALRKENSDLRSHREKGEAQFSGLLTENFNLRMAEQTWAVRRSHLEAQLENEKRQRQQLQEENEKLEGRWEELQRATWALASEKEQLERRLDQYSRTLQDMRQQADTRAQEPPPPPPLTAVSPGLTPIPSPLPSPSRVSVLPSQAGDLFYGLGRTGTSPPPPPFPAYGRVPLAGGLRSPGAALGFAVPSTERKLSGNVAKLNVFLLNVCKVRKKQQPMRWQILSNDDEKHPLFRAVVEFPPLPGVSPIEGDWQPNKMQAKEDASLRALEFLESVRTHIGAFTSPPSQAATPSPQRPSAPLEQPAPPPGPPPSYSFAAQPGPPTPAPVPPLTTPTQPPPPPHAHPLGVGFPFASIPKSLATLASLLTGPSTRTEEGAMGPLGGPSLPEGMMQGPSQASTGTATPSFEWSYFATQPPFSRSATSTSWSPGRGQRPGPLHPRGPSSAPRPVSVPPSPPLTPSDRATSSFPTPPSGQRPGDCLEEESSDEDEQLQQQQQSGEEGT
ncbi:unnamed protein product [Vitrella brassicaformis CCMP3155]|uniref:Uncharacterized protein n=3 Tax=Vitrella brassicaformis TaxID=1169539 RepID=A0A0G4EAX5_VITBC|nr:unnamed protein product [Vitrella brassicaformis CCMP3155]|eukprot:CEL92439.1 unnamed protein product [Vitrella brassicaformis CCMP3155]